MYAAGRISSCGSEKNNLACINTCMTFHSWLHKRLSIMPDADKISELIRLAGPNGIEEGQLRSAVELPKELVDNLLAALVSAAQATVVLRDGKRVYFAR
jgi:hypothetical protein